MCKRKDDLVIETVQIIIAIVCDIFLRFRFAFATIDNVIAILSCLSDEC